MIIVAFGGYFVFWKCPQEIKAIEKQQKKVDKKIDALSTVEVEFDEVTKNIKIEQEKLGQLNKQIVPEVPSARTYAYLNSIIQYVGALNFDMAYQRTENLKGYGYNIYRITGEGNFSNIYEFIWYLERGPEIYRIRDLSMQSTEQRNNETGKFTLSVPFNFELCAYFAAIPELPKIKNSLSDVRVIKQKKNPFYPYILRDVEPNKDLLVEVDRSTLKAVIPGKAYITDQFGKSQVLAVGDRVYLGRTSKIDPKRNQVTFTLNKGGVIEKYVLKLQFDARTEK